MNTLFDFVVFSVADGLRNNNQQRVFFILVKNRGGFAVLGLHLHRCQKDRWRSACANKFWVLLLYTPLRRMPDTRKVVVED